MASEDFVFNLCVTLCQTERSEGLCGTLCNKKGVLLILFISVFTHNYSQNDKLSETVTNIAEMLSEEESFSGDAELYIELLDELAENPVEINSGDEKELSRLFFLSDFQIRAIVDHTSVTGSIVSAYEIASIAGFDRQTVEMMMPFITLEPADINKPGKLRLVSDLISNLTFKPGENDTSMPGSHLRSLVKYKAVMGPFSAGITVEKDPGESFLTGSPPLPDFLSSFLSWTGKGFLKKVIVGDYSARFGEGTNINTRMRTGISLSAPGYMTGRDEIRPYTSTDENNFFRGAAMEISFRNAGLSLMFSQNKIDAEISSSDSGELYVSGLYKPGLHNTESSIMKKDALRETFYGAGFNYNKSPVRLGLTWSQSSFSLPHTPSGDDPEDLYRFSGSETGVFTAYYNAMFSRILLFGEISADYSTDIALVQGFTVRPSDRLQINMLGRSYSPAFVSFHGRGAGSSSSTSNESGLLGNFTFEAARHLFISAGCDIVSYPWLKYRTRFPSTGLKQELRLRFAPVDKFSFDALYSFRHSLSDNDAQQGMKGIEELSTRTFRAVFRYSPSVNFSVSTRIDYKKAEETGSRGMLLAQDIKLTFRHIPATIWLRHSVFSTDDWNSRIYAYENDLLHSFSIPALSGKGSRSYLMAEWEPGGRTDLRIKYGLTSIIDENGAVEERDELKFQLRVWF